MQRFVKLTTTQGKTPLKTLSVNVPRDIINGSQPKNFNRCMVAEAIQQKYPTATYILVDTAMIRFTLDGLRYYFIPPQNVKSFIADYDNGKTVHPFKFTTTFLARVVPSGFNATHPKGDNRTNPSKRYLPEDKKRKYGKRVRINGVCQIESTN